MKKISILALLLTFVCSMYAQKATEIIGKVIDSEQLPLPGANVVVKGTSHGVTADSNGNYKIKVDDVNKDVLVFSFIGLDSKEVKVNGRTVINITLESSSVQLDEVVAIGYGKTTRKDLTGSVTSVKSSDINMAPVSNVGQALAGKLAGVQVISTSGAPDADIAIRVRGGTSITQSNEPLYVIDGFPTEDGLRGLDPSDIESIDVLKDASSTAIYGSRGANGVVLVTTKGGKEGRSVLTVDAYFGMKKITKTMPVLSSLDYVKLEYERMLNSPTDLTKITNYYGQFSEFNDIYGNRPGIDWQKQVFDNNDTYTRMFKVGFSGGNKTTKYNFSYAHNDDDGIMMGSGLKRNAVRFQFDQQLNKTLRASANITYTDETTNGLGSLGEVSYFSRMQSIVQYTPVRGKGMDDNQLLSSRVDDLQVDDSGNQMQNPIISIQSEQNTKYNKYLIMNGSVEWKPLSFLTYKGMVGQRQRDLIQDQFYTSESRQAINAGAPYGSITTQNWKTFSISNTLSYNTKISPQQRFDAMIGQEYVTNFDRQLVTSSTNFPDDNFGIYDMSLGTTPVAPTSYFEDDKMLSYFARANYSFNDKYLFNISFRADGSSKFGADNKWGYFPSGAFAWRASEEKFIKDLNVFSNLKVRLSYGTSGNNRISNYQSLASMQGSWASVNKTVATSYYSSRLANPDLKWETVVAKNIGFDLGFLDQRIQATIDIYQNDTKDLLLQALVPLLSGYPSITRNVGQTRNSGIELSLTTYNIKNKNFTWSTIFNISSNKNTVKKLYNADYFTQRSGWCSTSEFNQDDYRIQVGRSLGEMWGYKYAGVYNVDDFVITNGQFAKDANGKYVPKDGVVYDKTSIPYPGAWKYADRNGDGTITTDDMGVIGNGTPVCFGGITNTFVYKNFDLTVYCNYSIGNDIYNANKMYYTKLNNQHRNVLSIASGRFTNMDAMGNNITNDPDALRAANPNPTMASVTGASNLVFSSWDVEDGSFIRLNTVSLGYTLPKKALKTLNISSLRCYVTAYNLYTLTHYSGFDPEVNAKPNGNLTPGVDWGAYPRAFSLVAGLSMAF
jgi:TonB-linked SusC/RagA family outer membrane protein